MWRTLWECDGVSSGDSNSGRRKRSDEEKGPAAPEERLETGN